MTASNAIVRAWPAVKYGQGPDNLVGIPYDDLTENQQFRLAVFRFGHGLCATCGYKWHCYLSCPKRKKQLDHRQKLRQCLACGSHKHKDENCPVRLRIQEATGPYSKDLYGSCAYELPKKVQYIRPATYTKAERKVVGLWLRRAGWCSYCNEPHTWNTCRSRLEKIQETHDRKIEALASGRKQLKQVLTGPFARLSPELRMMIFEKAFRVNAPLVVEPGYINPVVANVPFPRGEMLEAWLKTNTFCIHSEKALEHFENLMIRYQVHEHVRTELADIGREDIEVEWEIVERQRRH